MESTRWIVRDSPLGRSLEDLDFLEWLDLEVEIVEYGRVKTGNQLRNFSDRYATLIQGCPDQQLVSSNQCLSAAVLTQKAYSEMFRFNQPETLKLFDAKSFRNLWLAAGSRQKRIALSKRFGISDLEGLRFMGETWAIRVPFAAVFERLRLLAEIQLACNLECNISRSWRTYSGLLTGFLLRRDKIILSGEDLRVSIFLADIESAWMVSQPGSGRLQSSIELYRDNGNSLLGVYGRSEPRENAIWQDLLATLPSV